MCWPLEECYCHPHGGWGIWSCWFTGDISSRRAWPGCTEELHVMNAIINVRSFLEIEPSSREKWVSCCACQMGLFPTFMLQTNVIDCFIDSSDCGYSALPPPSLQPWESQSFLCTQASWWVSNWQSGFSLARCSVGDVTWRRGDPGTHKH